MSFNDQIELLIIWTSEGKSFSVQLENFKLVLFQNRKIVKKSLFSLDELGMKIFLRQTK